MRAFERMFDRTESGAAEFARFNGRRTTMKFASPVATR